MMHLLLSIHMVSLLFRSQSCMQYAPKPRPSPSVPASAETSQKNRSMPFTGICYTRKPLISHQHQYPSDPVKKTTTTSQSLSKVSGENRPILPLATANTESRRRVIGSGLLVPCLAALFQGPF
ncbi:hypothetical protein J3E68DRAFT_409810 [Trichoderma sp. SZMC 28012]